MDILSVGAGQDFPRKHLLCQGVTLLSRQFALLLALGWWRCLLLKTTPANIGILIKLAFNISRASYLLWLCSALALALLKHRALTSNRRALRLIQVRGASRFLAALDKFIKAVFLKEAPIDCIAQIHSCGLLRIWRNVLHEVSDKIFNVCRAVCRAAIRHDDLPHPIHTLTPRRWQGQRGLLRLWCWGRLLRLWRILRLA